MATVVITGANRGVGLALCAFYSDRGDTVIALCRESSPALEALDVEVHDDADVCDPHAMARIAAALYGRRVDILINNAGVLARDDFDELDLDAIQWQFETNTLGPLIVTDALRSLLANGSKLVIITSILGSIAENETGGMYGYRISKAAANMAGVSLARDLEEDGIAVMLMHPGYVATDMTSFQGTVTPEHAAKGIIARVDTLTMADTGSFWHAEGRRLDW